MIAITWAQRGRNEECYKAVMAANLGRVNAHLLSGRYQSVEQLGAVFAHNLAELESPAGLPDIERAARRIADAILKNEVIGIETDHDADGVTSHAVIYSALVNLFGHPESHVRSYIGHRLNEGYGLSDSLATRILADNKRPTLVITADNGSSDEPRIARLKAQGIDVIVTDHHEIPLEGPPKSAFSVVSPLIEAGSYSDKLIAGCMVAFLTMSAVRRELTNRKYFTNVPNMSVLLDFVALGTVADCVSLSRSKNNRLVVEHGLKLINNRKRPCWVAMEEFLDSRDRNFNSTDLAFSLAPRINARGRLDDAMLGVKFLLSQSIEEAVKYARVLNQENSERKEIEKKLVLDANNAAQEYLVAGYDSLVIHLPNGHAGVHGIVSSRITEKYGRPSIIISPKANEPGIVSASGRGIEGFNMRGALQEISNLNPDLFVKFGGHKGAAGMSLEESKIGILRNAFEKVVKQKVAGGEFKTGPKIMHDGPILAKYLSLDTIDQYSELEPFGREMDAPLFRADAQIKGIKKIGSNQDHLKLNLNYQGVNIDALWFSPEKHLLNMTSASGIKCLFSLSKNYYKGSPTLQMQIKSGVLLN